MTSPRKSSRRDFLKGRAAADRLLDITQGEEGDAAESGGGPAPASPRRSYLIQLGRKAMACEFEICLNAGQYPDGTEAAVAALDRIDELEDQLSVYREHSELSRLNRAASERAVPVERGVFELLAQALEIYRATGGAYDITSGPLSKAWGFFRRAGTMPSDEQIAEAVARVGGGFVELDPEHLTVRFLKPGLEVNVNSIGKGYALDRAADLLVEAGIDDFLFHGGQSSVLARGDHAAGGNAGWTVGLRHPMRPERRIAEFYLRDEALGTSGSGTQFFRHQGRRYGHLLDPRTGRPAWGVYSSTVLAPTAAEADALATAFYVMGPEATLEYCRPRPELGVLLVCPGERGGELAFYAAGLDERRHRRLAEV